MSRMIVRSLCALLALCSTAAGAQVSPVAGAGTAPDTSVAAALLLGRRPAPFLALRSRISIGSSPGIATPSVSASSHRALTRRARSGSPCCCRAVRSSSCSRSLERARARVRCSRAHRSQSAARLLQERDGGGGRRRIVRRAGPTRGSLHVRPDAATWRTATASLVSPIPRETCSSSSVLDGKLTRLPPTPAERLVSHARRQRLTRARG